MNFIDTARIYLKAGDGGDGCLSFLREKYRPLGGPSGGNGGHGGDIVLEAVSGLGTLLDFAHQPHLFGKQGMSGRGGRRHGRAGAELVVRVPIGTVVLRDGRPAADLSRARMRFVAARGGRGGRGNASFKSQRNTAPRIAEKGEKGEEVEYELELKLLADVGLVGLPNAGKSTFLSAVSNARPKIADYPFTTLVPNLGLVKHRERDFVFADIPGLIEGASLGKGLGSAFLRHIERTRVLVHLVDPMGFQGKTPVESLKAIEAELKAFGHGLPKKPRIVTVSKGDLPEGRAAVKALRRGRRKVLLISSVSGEGIRGLLDAVGAAMDRVPAPEPEAAPESDTHVLRIEKGFEVKPDGEGRFLVRGRDVERFAQMTRFDQPQALSRFQNILKKMGVDRKLKGIGVVPGDTVKIGEKEFEWAAAPPPRNERPRERRRRYAENRRDRKKRGKL